MIMMMMMMMMMMMIVGVDLLAQLAADEGHLDRVQRDLHKLLPHGRVRRRLLEGDSVGLGLDQLGDGKLGDPRVGLRLWVFCLLAWCLQLVLDPFNEGLVPTFTSRLKCCLDIAELCLFLHWSNRRGDDRDLDGLGDAVDDMGGDVLLQTGRATTGIVCQD